MQYVVVDPFSCMPFVRIRNTTKTPAFRFFSISTGRGTSNSGPAAAKISCVLDSAMDVPLDTVHKNVIFAPLQAKEFSLSDAKGKVGKQESVVHGIFNGTCRQEGITLLMGSDESSGNFKWARP